MKKNQKTFVSNAKACTWRHFDNKAYSAFRSISREVRIGVLAVATLASAGMAEASVAVDATQVSTVSEDGFSRELNELEVTGSLAPISANQAARIVTTIGREEIAQSAAQSVNDLLKLALGVDVRQRGAFGVQTDISIDGGSFDQVTILLNGVNIGSPQTGHLSADFPVSINDIIRIEVLEGAASRSVGGSSFSGAVNIVTRPDAQNHVTVNAQGGQYGTFGGGAQVAAGNEAVRNQFSVEYRQSDGATQNSAFKRGNAFYQGSYSGEEVNVDWQLGYSNQDYGANTFYSAAYPNQHEQNSRYFVAVKASTKGKIKFEPTIYWTRSTDHFELIHGSNVGENFHRSDVYGGRLNSYFNWAAGTTSFGAEVRNEGILSTNLGRPLEESEYVKIPGKDGFYNKRDNRTNVSYFAEHNILLKDFTLSMGVVANMNTALDSRFRWYPGVDLSYRPADGWRLSASWNMAFRMPTFTDLYYKSPTTEGNIGLKPEKTQNVIVAARYQSAPFSATLRGFYHHGVDMIDWVMYAADDKYHSTNFRLNNLGAEVTADINFANIFSNQNVLQTLSLGYTYIHQTRHDNQEIFKSNYALDYLRHKFTARLTHRIFGPLSATWNLRWQDRLGGYLEYVDAKPTGEIVEYKPYAVLDLKLQFVKPRYELWVSANNLTDHTYHDFGNIPQPGLWIMAGGSYRFNF